MQDVHKRIPFGALNESDNGGRKWWHKEGLRMSLPCQNSKVATYHPKSHPIHFIAKVMPVSVSASTPCPLPPTSTSFALSVELCFFFFFSNIHKFVMP